MSSFFVRLFRGTPAPERVFVKIYWKRDYKQIIITPMRVLFISANRSEINMRTIPLGLCSVASAARQWGHTVKILDMIDTGDVYSTLAGPIEEFEPQVIAISIRNIDDQSMEDTEFFFEKDKEVINMAKRLSNAVVILGGAGYSIFPEAVLDRSDGDMGIWGEGEDSFRLLLYRIEKNLSLDNLPGVYIKGYGLQGARIFQKNLDLHPLPEADLLLSTSVSGHTDVWTPVQTRRGCPMGCSYCSTAAIEGTQVRKRSPGTVAEWIGRLAKEEGLRRFYFVDNTFNVPPSYAKSLCRELTDRALGITWRCIVYPRKIDEELAAVMAEAGCVETSIGFESGCEEILRGMRKKFKKDDVRETTGLLKKYRIQRMGFMLLGGPQETRQSVMESLSFAESLELDMVKTTIGIRIYPHTLLAEQARREGIIAHDDDLLFPRFYIKPGLEGYIREAVARYAGKRPGWLI